MAALTGCAGGMLDEGLAALVKGRTAARAAGCAAVLPWSVAAPHPSRVR